MRLEAIRAAGCALLAAGTLAACGSSGGSTTSSADNGVASKPPEQIIKAASNAIGRASAVHVAGSLVSSGTPLSLDLSLVSGKGGKGSLSEGGLSFDLIAVGQNVYIHGTRAFWSRFGNAALARIDGKWLKAPAAGQFASVASLTNMQQLFGKFLLSHGVLKKGGTSTVNGQPVVAVTDTTQGGTIYIATSGQPYPVEATQHGKGGGHITFDRVNQPVSLVPPTNVVALSQLH